MSGHSSSTGREERNLHWVKRFHCVTMFFFFFLISRSQQVCGQSLWIEKYLSVSHAVGTNQVGCDLFCLYKCLFCHGFFAF